MLATFDCIKGDLSPEFNSTRHFEYGIYAFGLAKQLRIFSNCMPSRSICFFQLADRLHYDWIILTGLGAYLAYVPFGCVLFDRIIAHTRAVGTAVFAIYVADAIGYTGAISILLYKNLAGSSSAGDFFHDFSYFTAALSALCFAGSCVYFVGRRKATSESSG